MNDVVRLAKALADATRVQMLSVVAAQGSVCCGDLARALRVSQATVTHHLRVLTGARLVETHRDGAFVRVHACRQGLEEGQAALAALIPREATAERPDGTSATTVAALTRGGQS